MKAAGVGDSSDFRRRIFRLLVRTVAVVSVHLWQADYPPRVGSSLVPVPRASFDLACLSRLDRLPTVMDPGDEVCGTFEVQVHAVAFPRQEDRRIARPQSEAATLEDHFVGKEKVSGLETLFIVHKDYVNDDVSCSLKSFLINIIYLCIIKYNICAIRYAIK